MPTRWDDVGRGSAPPALAARLRAAASAPGYVGCEVIWQAGRPTSLVTTYRAPLAELDRVTALLTARGCNARLAVTAGGVEWTISEPLDRPAPPVV